MDSETFEKELHKSLQEGRGWSSVYKGISLLKLGHKSAGLYTDWISGRGSKRRVVPVYVEADNKLVSYVPEKLVAKCCSIVGERERSRREESVENRRRQRLATFLAGFKGF